VGTIPSWKILSYFDAAIALVATADALDGRPAFIDTICLSAFQLRKAGDSLSNATVNPSLSRPVRAHCPWPVEEMVMRIGFMRVLYRSTRAKVG
jgi:hypothetical protein